MAKPDPLERAVERLEKIVGEACPDMQQRIAALEVWVRVLVKIAGAIGLLTLGLLVELLLRLAGAK